MQNAEFEGQTKEKLGNISIKSLVDSIVYSVLSTYLEENPADASSIVRKVLTSAEARESAKRARELVRKKSAFEGALLPGKLSDCTESDPGEGGDIHSRRRERSRIEQAGQGPPLPGHTPPLKGKILNVEKASDEKIFNNAELHTMVTAFGTGIKETFNPEAVRYKKIVMLTDADVDGSHIRTLLMTFFYRYMRALIDRGNIYIAQPPLYKVSKGKEVQYVYSDRETECRAQEI